MIFGTIVGTFSSIFIASPLLYHFNKNRKLLKFVEEKETKKEENTRYVV
jgi:preprotein translocase subunit SecF